MKMTFTPYLSSHLISLWNGAEVGEPRLVRQRTQSTRGDGIGRYTYRYVERRRNSHGELDIY
jgi:hypothetical protein